MSQTVLMCKWQAEVLSTFLDLGCEVVLVIDGFDIAHEHPDAALLGACRAVYEIDSFDCLEQIAAVAGDLLAKDIRPDVVFAHTEFSQLGTGYLEQLLGLDTAALRRSVLRDKRLMKTAVAQAGVPVPDWCSVTGPHDADGIRQAASRLSYPLVVKPAFGVGTTNTFLVRHPTELADGIATVRSDSVIRSRHLIVEEFVAGRELHVDALWVDGEPRFFLISTYLETRLDVANGAGNPGRLDGSCILPPEDAPDLYGLVGALHRRINAGLRISDGVTHTEFFHCADGAVIFGEAAARLGGGWIPQVLNHHLGASVWSIVAEAAATGRTPEWPPPSTYLGGLNLRPMRPGKIVQMPNPAAVLATPGVRSYTELARVGDESVQQAAAEWAAIVVIEAETEAEYCRIAAELVSRHPIATEPSGHE